MPTFDVARADHEFVDAHGVTIQWYVWRAARPKGIVQVVHGLGEHALRYERVAQELVRAGYTVYADDHRGHGRTGLAQWDGDATKLGRLGDGGLRAAVDGVTAFTDLIREEEPDLPLAAVGQSWGSLMVQMVVDRDPRTWDAVVLLGTAHRTPWHMAAGDLNKRHAHLGDTGFEWISRDPAVHRAMADDPLVVDAKALALFGLRDSLRLLGRPAKGAARVRDVPVLIAVGTDDALGGEKSAVALARDYVERSGYGDVEVHVYGGARHELLTETNRDEVVGDLLTWLGTRLRTGGTPA